MTTHVDLLTADEAARHAGPVEGAGIGALDTSRGNLPLDAIDVRATVTGLAHRTELTQGFRNLFDEPLEATYIFPLPSRSAVTALRMEADGRVVDGVLKERGEAREEYDRAIDAGQRASIAEEERPGVFTMRVGNILPGERVTITVTLVGQLPYEDGAATFRFPLVVAPRYIPGTPLPGEPVGTGTSLDTDAVPDASRITPPVLLPGFPNPIRLSAEVDVDTAALPVRDVRSSMPVTTVDGDDGRLLVRLAAEQRANRDFVLRLALGADHAVSQSLSVVPDEEGDEATFVLTVLPPVGAAPPRPRDLVVVLDRSGSMSGWKMVAARRAAARIVDTLTAADRFAVLAFDHAIESPVPTLVPASDQHRARAVAFLAELDARGGTELLAPLERAADLLAEADSGRERAVLLVTDGQVGNEDQILRALAPRLDGVRVYTVGVDTAVNDAFLRRLAMICRGRCELVESEDGLEDAVAAIHRRINGPLVTDLSLSAPGAQLDAVSPTRLPDLFAGAPVVISGRVRGRALGTVTVSGTAAGAERWEETLAAAPTADRAVAACWARARVRDLEDRYVTAAAGVGHENALDDLERELTETSLRFGVLCRFTAFVAVDSRIVAEGGATRRVTQPLDLPHGWAPPPGAGAGGAGFAPMAAAPDMAAPMTFAAPPPMVTRGTMLGGPRGKLRTLAAAVHATPTDTGEIEPPVRADIARMAAQQLAHLHAAAGGSLADRARALRQVAEAIGQLRLDDAPTDPVERSLRALAIELTAAPSDPVEFERLWLSALDTLEALAEHPPADPDGPQGATPPAERQGFWRR